MFAQYWPEFIVFATASVLSLISPGPDFLMVVRTSLRHSRQTAIWVAFGISCGEMVHVAYTLLGIGWMISESVVAFTILKYIGAVYLIFIGAMSLQAKAEIGSVGDTTHQNQNPSIPKAFVTGFLTNVSNVKAAFFTISFFTVLVSSDTPLWVQLIYAAFIQISTFIWFSFVATLLTHPIAQKRFMGMKHWIERTCGILLIAIGIGIIL